MHYPLIVIHVGHFHHYRMNGARKSAPGIPPGIASPHECSAGINRLAEANLRARGGSDKH